MVKNIRFEFITLGKNRFFGLIELSHQVKYLSFCTMKMWRVKKEKATEFGNLSYRVAHSNDFPNEVTKSIEVNPEDIWDILEENKQLANLKDLIEPLEEQRLKEEQERTQRDNSQVVQ